MNEPLPIIIREMLPDDARAWIEVHHKAIREIAVVDYPEDVIEAWAPTPVTDEIIDLVRANPDNEFRLVAELQGRIVGICAAVLKRGELCACYVVPELKRKEIGAALIKSMETIAKENEVPLLTADASITAELFYRTQGFKVEGRGEHILRNGKRMACIQMRKSILSHNS